MNTKIIAGISVALLLTGFAGAVQAKSIKSQVSDSALASYCAGAGLGHHMASITLADGSTVTGSVHCEAEDLIVGSDDGPNHDLFDDNGGDRNGNDDGPNHDLNDDHGGHGNDDGPNHDVGDDHGGNGNDDGPGDDNGGGGGSGKGSDDSGRGSNDD